MDRRLELQALLETLGAEAVYFQAPSNVQMKYPAIVYQLDDLESRFAGNLPYTRIKRYQVMVIDQDPDSEIPDRVSDLPTCTMSTYFRADNLHHTVFNLYF